MLKTIASTLLAVRKDPLLLILLVALPVLIIFSPLKFSEYPSLVDWPTIAALTGLLTLTKGLEVSGALHHLGQWMIKQVAGERSLALSLVMASALLSTLLTNDVALFVVVPLTLGVCRITGVPAARMVIFEALAVNVGSALTPIGNPQNLFLWQTAGISFGAFVLHMLPFVAGSMVLLLSATACMFSSRTVRMTGERHAVALDTKLMGVALLLYIPFLVATDLHYAVYAVAVVLLVLGLLRPKILVQVDWALLLVFVLMFVDLRLLAGLDAVYQFMTQLKLELPRHLYLAGIAASQVISNVPAAIALAAYSKDWRVLAYAVNVGGFGLVVGSLANVIALRMLNDRKAWLSFHLYAFPALLIATGLGYALLF